MSKKVFGFLIFLGGLTMFFGAVLASIYDSPAIFLRFLLPSIFWCLLVLIAKGTLDE